MMLGKGSFVNAGAQIAAKLGPQKARNRRYRRFALVSPDMAVDNRGRSFVEEINTNGMIMGTHERMGGYRDLFHDEDYIKAMLQILGADDYPRRDGYGAKLSTAIDTFCASYAGQCTARLRRELATVVHEEAHAGPHWYRLYPPLQCHRSRHGGACESDSHGHWWPEQARVTRSMREAMGETELERAIYEFVTTTDTQAIHGETTVPGHGRWYPRVYHGIYAP